VLVVNAKKYGSLDFKAFLAQVKASPGKLNYGSAGGGTSHHLAGELFKQQTRTFITHIPYRGAGPALNDLIAGNVDMMFDGLGSSAGHIKGGRIKALMVSGDKRNPAFPDVPCAAELGLPDYTVTTWYGVWAPRGTPAEAQARAIEEIRKAAQTDEARAVWAGQGAEFPNLTGAQFDGFVKGELRSGRRWSRPLVRNSTDRSPHRKRTACLDTFACTSKGPSHGSPSATRPNSTPCRARCGAN
jgi:tripartite-type tricarboxylate transporter receptor subunit TctC